MALGLGVRNPEVKLIRMINLTSSEAALGAGVRNPEVKPISLINFTPRFRTPGPNAAVAQI